MSTHRKCRVFLSRTTAGLKTLAAEVAEILEERGAEPVVQTDFLPDWRSVPQMLQERLISCDCVIALIGPVHGSEPEREPAKLNDPRSHGRKFSFTQWEYLVARDLRRPVFTFLVSGPDIVASFESEDPSRQQRQQLFIDEFAKDRSTLYYEYSDRNQLLDHVRKMDLPLSVVAGKPTNIPYASLGTLFKGRDEFLTQLHAQLTAATATVIKGHRAIHGMGGVGKTRAAIEYAWKHADNYNALLFVAADTIGALNRNLASLCGPMVLNLPEQDEKDMDIQLDAVLRWLDLHPGWFLIIDNVDTEDTAVETRSLLERLSKGHVVITSRISDWSSQVSSLDLDVLSEASSIEFLNERTSERRISGDSDAEHVQRLVQILDCLALALEQAGAQISYQRISYAEYIAIWESNRPAVLAWHDEETMKYPRSLAITYETSVGQLSPGARELFQTVAWFAPDPIPRQLLDFHSEPNDQRRHLGEIERLHLARFQIDGKSFTVHRLNQEITRQQQLEPRPERLVGALVWMDLAYQGETDVRNWLKLLPLTPHAISVGNFGAHKCDLKVAAAPLLHKAAVLIDSQADYGRAEPLYQLALAIKENYYGDAHTEVAGILNNYGLLLRHTNRLAEAEPMFRRALSINEQSYGVAHPDVATVLLNLAGLFQSKDCYTEAEPMLRRALTIKEKLHGSDHADVAKVLNNLGLLLVATNRLAEAEPILRRALSIEELSHGVGHPDFARSLQNLALLLQRTNRLAEAEPILRRALAIVEQAFGADHPQIANNLNNLALLLRDMNRLAEAEAMLCRALTIDELTYGKEHPDVARDLYNLAGLLEISNRRTEAEPLYLRALTINENSYGVNHPAVAGVLNNLGCLLRDTNRLVEAEPVLLRALSIDEQFYGIDHPDVARDLLNLALVLKHTNRLAEAEHLMSRSLIINEQSYGKEHPNVAVDLYNLGLLLKDTKRLAEAELLHRRALKIQEKSYGADHPDVARNLYSLARVLASTSRLTEAESLMHRALAVCQIAFGPDDPDTQTIRRSHEALLREIDANAVHPYLQLQLLKRKQQAAIQAEDYELAAKCRDELGSLQSAGNPRHFDRDSLQLLDRVLGSSCIAIPVKLALGGRLISAEMVQSVVRLLKPGISVIEEHFEEFADFRFRDLCDELSQINDKNELFSKLGVTSEAQKQDCSVSPEAWLAYAIYLQLQGSGFLYCIANRWVQMSPTKEEVFQVAQVFEGLGYTVDAQALRSGFINGYFDTGA